MKTWGGEKQRCVGAFVCPETMCELYVHSVAGK